MEGLIFDTQRFSLDDGPGIRTTVFLKGCGLRCLWCHNPESISPEPEVLFREKACAGCGACAAACPVGARAAGRLPDGSLCLGCGRCADACVFGALERAGRRVSAGELIQELERDRLFYEASGGGVTFSGGEPLLQHGFVREALERCRFAGLHTAVDTAGHVPWAAFEAVSGLADLFLFDIKLADAERHRAVTGADNRLILANLAGLLRTGARVWVRVPVIPGVNAGDGEMRAVADLVGKLGGIGQVKLLRYHAMGEGKRAMLGGADGFTPDHVPADAEMERIAAIFRERVLGAEILHS